MSQSSQSVTDTVKAWSAPLLLTIILGLCGTLWAEQRTRIASLETQAAAAANALAVVSSNQEISKEDRQAFQDAATKRLDQVADALTRLNDAVVRLTTLQEREPP